MCGGSGGNKLTEDEKNNYTEFVKPRLADITEWRAACFPHSKIYKALGISRDQYTLYRRQYPELEAALQEGEAAIVGTLEDVLYSRAIGYTKTFVETKRKYEGGVMVSEEKITRERFIQSDKCLIAALNVLAPHKYKYDNAEDLLNNVAVLVEIVKSLPDGKLKEFTDALRK